MASKACCIKGCEHRCSGFTTSTIIAIKNGEEPCTKGNSSFIVDARLIENGPHPDPFVGFACPHCTEAIAHRG